MALILCPHCGKNVSDTLKKCIHCQQMLQTKISTEGETNKPIKNESKPKEPQRMKFANRGKGDQQNLMKEFWKDDKWGKRYFRMRKELPSMISDLWFFLILCFVLVWAAAMAPLLVELKNPALHDTLFYFIIAGAVCCVLLLIVFYSLKAYYKLSKKDLYYWKRFQRWLLEKRDMDYTLPKSYSEQDRWAFECIELKDDK